MYKSLILLCMVALAFASDSYDKDDYHEPKKTYDVAPHKDSYPTHDSYDKKDSYDTYDKKDSYDSYDKKDSYDTYDKKDSYGHKDSYAHTGYGYGANRAREHRVNYYNGLRQKAVNYVAEHVGAGTGTAAKYGVPGTHVNGYGYGHDGYGARAGYGGYGHGYDRGYDHGYNGGYGGYGDHRGYGKDSYGYDGYY